jgi:hypothetical protein
VEVAGYLATVVNYNCKFSITFAPVKVDGMRPLFETMIKQPNYYPNF